jgi:hypothetical protein
MIISKAFELLRSILLDFQIDLLEEIDFDPYEMRGHILLRRGRSKQLFRTQYIEPMTVSEARKAGAWDEGREDVLYLGDVMADKSAAAFRDSGLQFADRCGNAYLEFGDVYVDVRGRRPMRSLARYSPVKHAPDAAQNLFSRRRAQVLFALLTWPEVITWTVREISEVSGVSLGQAQQTLKQLDIEGFHVDRVNGEILDRKKLFDLWVMNYPRYLAPSLNLESFRGEVNEFHHGHHVQLGGETAIPNLIRPSTLVIYADKFIPEMALQNRWRRSDEPNVFVRHKFWTEPRFVRERAELRGESIVPSTLIYADLLASGDARQREAAELLEESDDRLLAITRS